MITFIYDSDVNLFWQRDFVIRVETKTETVLEWCTSSRYGVGDCNETLCRLYESTSMQNRHSTQIQLNRAQSIDINRLYQCVCELRSVCYRANTVQNETCTSASFSIALQILLTISIRSVSLSCVPSVHCSTPVFGGCVSAVSNELAHCQMVNFCPKCTPHVSGTSLIYMCITIACIQCNPFFPIDSGHFLTDWRSMSMLNLFMTQNNTHTNLTCKQTRWKT